MQFKYILCSYLSALRRLACMRSINSNTSYVLIYRKISIGCKPPFFIQIHPMFLFIGRKVLGWILEGLFKYILCSYLSSDFDTDFITTALFKYILCSYLSGVLQEVLHHRPPFKYILCSYLSMTGIWLSILSIDSNTSYVLIYHTNLSGYVTTEKHSNTSYVLIYRNDYFDAIKNVSNSNTSYVLIYLYMGLMRGCLVRFKYILCSYLSPNVLYFSCQVHYSNTSYVLIYRGTAE